jgi:hypothetical protein
MLKILVSIVFLSAVAATFAEAQTGSALDAHSLQVIRHGFYEAIESHKKTDEMLHYIDTHFTGDTIDRIPLLEAYAGILHALKAKHVFSPFSKISHLRKGLRLLNHAVESAPAHFEVRFLRFSLLHNIPSFLGYRDALRHDTEAVFTLLVVEGKYTELDQEMALNIIEFILDSKRLNEEQTRAMQSLGERLEAHEQLSSD